MFLPHCSPVRCEAATSCRLFAQQTLCRDTKNTRTQKSAKYFVDTPEINFLNLFCIYLSSTKQGNMPNNGPDLSNQFLVKGIVDDESGVVPQCILCALVTFFLLDCMRWKSHRSCLVQWYSTYFCPSAFDQEENWENWVSMCFKYSPVLLQKNKIFSCSSYRKLMLMCKYSLDRSPGRRIKYFPVSHAGIFSIQENMTVQLSNFVETQEI